MQVGWPMMLPSKERRPFAGKVHELKKKHLNNMVMDGKLPLRPGQVSPSYPCLLAICTSTNMQTQPTFAKGIIASRLSLRHISYKTWHRI